jgi:hypothetical protein
MRTRLRSKITLLFVVCAVLIAIPGAAALAQDTGTPAAPTIQSDKADYAAGELVTLTGSGWLPGESVNINVNDDVGQSWNRNVNVTADQSGNITDQFNLPDWFVATYSVKATGASGAVATTTFTDGQVRVKAVGTAGASAPISWTRYSSTDCTGTVVDNGSFSAGTTGNGTTVQDANGNMNLTSSPSQSLKLTAGSVSGRAFSGWSPAADFTTGTFTSASNPGCLKGSNSTLNIDVNYVSDATAPTVTVVSASPATLGEGDSSTITWKANENGSFSVRVGGTSCSTGTQVASGNYTTQPNNTTSTVNATSARVRTRSASASPTRP